MRWESSDPEPRSGGRSMIALEILAQAWGSRDLIPIESLTIGHHFPQDAQTPHTLNDVRCLSSLPGFLQLSPPRPQRLCLLVLLSIRVHHLIQQLSLLPG